MYTQNTIVEISGSVSRSFLGNDNFIMTAAWPTVIVNFIDPIAEVVKCGKHASYNRQNTKRGNMREKEQDNAEATSFHSFVCSLIHLTNIY